MKGSPLYVFLPVVLLLQLHANAATPSASVTGCNSTPPIPAVPSHAVTFRPTAAQDQFRDLQSAIDKLRTGDSLVLAPGTYPISHHLTIQVDGVTIYGNGATLQSTSSTDGAVVIRGDNVSIFKLTLNQNNQGRQTTPWAGGISVYDDRGGTTRRIQSPIIVGNTINNSAGSGIFLYKANRFTVAGNRVYRSLADGIHATAGSTNGRIVQNTVRQTGDDMIAIVSYAGKRNAMTAAARFAGVTPDDSLDSNIYVAENDVSDQYWGRGISVVGGSNVTIENNTISKVPFAAGIYLLRETSYETFGDHNILVRNNNISEIQTQPATYQPPGFKGDLTHHGAVEVASQADSEEWSSTTYRNWLGTTGIEIAGNSIHNAKFGGIRLGANSPVNKTLSNVSVHDNKLSSVGDTVVAATYPGTDASTLVCSQNTVDGTLWQSNCDSKNPAAGKVAVTVVGASLSCRADGAITGTGPNPPQDVKIQ